ncbi:hypothetical protein RUM43_005767 [Polyplax serrata]|uniref:Uncharacterized protein n=1 Tax=Polyplax serrata TaxID=468196 RepID=A0AAN8PDZ6_POLSC
MSQSDQADEDSQEKTNKRERERRRYDSSGVPVPRTRPPTSTAELKLKSSVPEIVKCLGEEIDLLLIYLTREDSSRLAGVRYVHPGARANSRMDEREEEDEEER